MIILVNYKHNKLIGWGFVLPLVLFVLLFMVYPIIFNIKNSFYDWNGVSDTKLFIGLDNYVTLFKDPIFLISVRNFLLFAILTVAVQCGLGLFLANMFRKKFIGRDFTKTMLFMPAVLSSIIIGQIFYRIMDPNTGYLNQIFHAIHLDFLAGSWLSNPKTAVYIIILVNIWQWTGYSVMLYFGAMMSIPEDLYEAAYMDGANGFQVLTQITTPLVRGTTFNLTIVGVIGALKQYDLVAALTAGGPADSTQTFATFMYQAAFGLYKQGYSSAIAVVMFVIALLVTIVQLRLYNADSK